MAKSKYDLPKLLVLIGGVITLIQGILNLITPSWFSWWGALITILVGIIVLMQVDLIPNKIGVPYNKIWVLIMGIITIIFAAWWGGILILIAAILMFLGKAK